MPIKPSYIKNLGNELLETYGDRFTNDFSENKLLVDELADVGSKRVRNRVAGYITAKINKRKHH
ncbi:MAG: 30S ribosomal protein S17e [Methanoculleaceae archaeon]